MTREMRREGELTEVVDAKIPPAEALRDGGPAAAEGGIPPARIPRPGAARRPTDSPAVTTAGPGAARRPTDSPAVSTAGPGAARGPTDSPAVSTAGGDEPIAGVGDIRLEEADVGRGFSGNPVKFAVRAVFYYAGKAADKVVSLYSRAFRLDREYVADFNRSTGIAHAERGLWEKAIPLLEKALAINPDDHETRMHLARACGNANRYERAYLHLEKALKASPNSGPVVRALGNLCSRRQKYEQAIQYLKRAVELDPDHAQSFYRLGAAYDNRKLYDEAVDSFKEAIRLDPRFAKAYQALGFTYESMGDRESAVECFKKALELE